MIISLVAAMDENHVIGNAGGIPWYVPAEMRHFRQLTRGKPVIMGRKTFESIGKRALLGRHNIVMTRDTQLKAEGVTVVHSIEEALNAARAVDPD